MSTGRCLILGGNGFIGSHLAELLLEKGFEVRIFSRSANLSSGLIGIKDAVEYCAGDFADAEAVARAVKGCDYVCHLVSTTVPTTSDHDVIVDTSSNLISTLKLLEICVRESVKQLIFSSSGGTVYGRVEKEDQPISEGHPTLPQCSYGIVKVAIESYLELFRVRYGLDYTVLRISNCYGPRLPLSGEQGVVGIFLTRLRRGEPIILWGDGSVTRDYIYVSDVAAAFLAALGQKSPFRVFNVGTGVGTSLLHLIRTIERQTGCSFQIIEKPSRAIDVPVNILDTTRARTALSWESATSLEQGLLNTWNWIRQELPQALNTAIGHSHE